MAQYLILADTGHHQGVQGGVCTYAFCLATRPLGRTYVLFVLFNTSFMSLTSRVFFRDISSKLRSHRNGVVGFTVGVIAPALFCSGPNLCPYPSAHQAINYEMVETMCSMSQNAYKQPGFGAARMMSPGCNTASCMRPENMPHLPPRSLPLPGFRAVRKLYM